jgi:hypothetical protein
LIPGNAVWVAHSESVWGITYLTIVALFFNVVTTLFVLVVANYALGRLRVRALSQGELLTVFSLLSVGCSVAGNNFMVNLILTLGHATWYATPENEWAETMLPYLPSWLVVGSRDAVAGFYRGDSAILQQPQLEAWLKPLGWWFLFIAFFLWVLLCMAVVFRRQWTEHEKLTYPIVQVPLQLTRTETDGHLLRSKVFLFGAGIAASAQIVNGIHFYVPSVPAVQIRFEDVSPFIRDKPWDAIGWTPLTAYFWVIGIVYFIPLELSFSCWFFYFASKAQRVLGSATGLTRLPGFPFSYEQTTGGWMGLFFASVWFARSHLRHVWDEARKPEGSTEETPISYRVAVWGFGIGLAALVGFLLAMGFSPYVAVLFPLIVLATSLTIMKIRAELGPPQNEFYNTSAEPILVTAFGTRFLGRRNLALMPLLFFTNRTLGSHPGPHFLEAFKLAQTTRTPLRSQRRLAVAMLIAAGIGAVSAAWGYLDAGYRWGAESRFTSYWALAWESFGAASARIQSPQGPDWWSVGATLIGVGASSLMMALRSRFLWWPLHPVGYVLSTSGWIINYLWFSFLLTWFIKTLVLRLGGYRMHRRLAPLFVGFVVGEIVVGSLWSLLGVLLGRESYGFYED